jgi:hypothetical protein
MDNSMYDKTQQSTKNTINAKVAVMVMMVVVVMVMVVVVVGLVILK